MVTTYAQTAIILRNIFYHTLCLFRLFFTLNTFVSLMFVNWWIFQQETGCLFGGVQQNYLQNLDECKSSKDCIHFSNKSMKPNFLKH